MNEQTFLLFGIKVDDVKKVALLLRAINHRLRRDILRFLFENKSSTVTELYIAFRIDQSVCSQHLAILRRSGFVKTVREGKYTYYSVDEKKFELIASAINTLL